MIDGLRRIVARGGERRVTTRPVRARVAAALSWSLLLVILMPAAVLRAGMEDARAERSGDERLEQLERRVEELEAEQSARSMDSLAWTDRIRLGGSANTGFYGGHENSVVHDAGFRIWDARFFVDADLGRAVRLFDATLVRNVGFTFEWNLVRVGDLSNDVGELYVDFQAIAGSDWLNLQAGRFQIPVGESYLRYSRGYSGNPFISTTVGGAWFWDEGVKLYGGGLNGWLSYVASISQGETSFGSDLSPQKQYTVKLVTDPTDWLHLSVSAAYTGAIGSTASRGSGAALWLGESWARGFGALPAVPNYVGGVPVPNGPNRIDRTYFIGGDAIFELADEARLWLSYGYYDIDQGGSLYDRGLHGWTAELLLFGGLVDPRLEPIHLGLRVSGLGTYDSDIGDLLDARTAGILGYDAESITDYSVALGWKMLRQVTLRLEYTRRVIAVVRGADAAIRRASRDHDSWGVEVGIHF